MNIFKTYRKTSLFFLIIFILVGGLYWAVDYSQKFTPEDIASLEKQAESGDAEAMYILGTIYDLGEGVPVNYEIAKKYYELAIEKDYPKAFYRLGMLYLHGDGVTKNTLTAFDNFKIATLNNVSHAFAIIAIFYLRNDLLDIADNTLAFQYLEKAAQYNIAEAQYLVGAMYSIGQGVKKNKAKARYYYAMASENAKTFSSTNFHAQYQMLMQTFFEVSSNIKN